MLMAARGKTIVDQTGSNNQARKCIGLGYFEIQLQTNLFSDPLSGLEIG
jgi:hypothetical protein